MSESNESEPGLGALIAIAGAALTFGLVKKVLEKPAQNLPSELSHLLDQAYAEMEGGNYPKAYSIYMEVLRKDPQSALAHNQIAWLLAIHNENLPQALQHAELAIQHASSSEHQAGFRDTYAEVLAMQGSFDHAILEFRQAIAQFPEIDSTSPDYNSSYRLGRCYFLKRDFPSAITALKKALEVNPSNPLIWLTVGDACFAAESYSSSIPYYNEALVRIPKWEFQIPLKYQVDLVAAKSETAGYCLINLGAAYYRINNLAQSRKANEQALIVAPNYPHPHVNLAIFSARDGKSESVLQHLETGIPLIQLPRDMNVLVSLINDRHLKPFRQQAVNLLRNHQIISATDWSDFQTNAEDDQIATVAIQDSIFINPSLGGNMTTFNQQNQQVLGSQQNAGGDILNSAGDAVKLAPDVQHLISEIEKLRSELAANGTAIDAELIEDANHQLTRAANQLAQPEPKKPTVLGYLQGAKSLLESTGALAPVVEGLSRLIHAVASAVR